MNQQYKINYAFGEDGGDIPHGAIVTNSSAAVGCIATQLSKSAFVAPILRAMPKPCSSSSEPIPMIRHTDHKTYMIYQK